MTRDIPTYITVIYYVKLSQGAMRSSTESSITLWIAWVASPRRHYLRHAWLVDLSDPAMSLKFIPQGTYC